MASKKNKYFFKTAPVDVPAKQLRMVRAVVRMRAISRLIKISGQGLYDIMEGVNSRTRIKTKKKIDILYDETVKMVRRIERRINNLNKNI